MRLLVTGSRDWTDYLSVVQELTRLHEILGIDVVIEGECRGADRLAARAAKKLGFDVLPFPAEWDKYGNGAGPIRNQQMLDEGKPDFVLVFHNNLGKSKGTKDMVARARKIGLPVLQVKQLGRVKLP